MFDKKFLVLKRDMPFRSYLCGDPRNRMLLGGAAGFIALQFIVFKYFYPYASYIHGDSFSYLDAAYNNLDISTYMIGYSRFLRFVSVFSKSDLVLVAFQYLLIYGSSQFFLFTILYFYKPGRIIKVGLIFLTVINPLFPYLANLVSSDGLFLSLSLLWFSFLLWIIHRPSVGALVVLHTLVLLLAFTVRYNALIYPFISVLVFLLSRLPVRSKTLGIGAGVLVCGLFMLFTGDKYKELTGTWQYSPFGGWQIANNAMYAYRNVDSTDRKPVPVRFRKLDAMIRNFYDTTRDVKKHPREAWEASTVYMWDPRTPLYKYRNTLFAKDSTASEFRMWASMGSFYRNYGIYIIRNYPLQYIRYFIWPSAKRYYAPPVEFLAYYNSQKNYVAEVAQYWFEYNSSKVTTRTNDLKVNVLSFYPILAGMTNIIFVCSFICFMVLKGYKKNVRFRDGLLLATLFWIANASFTIIASPAALRFQAFPIVVMAAFSMLLIEWLYKEGKGVEEMVMKQDKYMEGITIAAVIPGIVEDGR